MSALRFNHVFASLLGLSFISSFLAPRYTAASRPQLQVLFSPVSRPVRGVAALLSVRFGRQRTLDQASPAAPRPMASIYEENEQLRQQVAILTNQLEELKQYKADFDVLGNVQAFCRVCAVVGGDAGTHESLLLGGMSAGKLRDGMPVLYREGIAGQIEHAGVAGAQVRLLSDRGFEVGGSFGKFQHDANGQVSFIILPKLKFLVEGAGSNGMLIHNSITMAQVKEADLGVNDWVVLDDSDWPDALRGYKLGRISSPIKPQDSAPLYAEIHLRPAENLMQLRDVMVYVGHDSGYAVQGSSKAQNP